MIYWKILSVLSLVIAQDPVVNLPQGRIVGMKVYTENPVTSIEIFFGIPYAMAPIGKLRFSAPERHTGWRRTFYAHRIPPRCPQPGSNNSDFSEDCLFLNIWTTRRVDGKLQPVLVILYSDSWSHAGINLPCQELAAEGIVVVTVTFRLHLLSFFTLKSIAARGNLALLDQYLALVWVRENIAAFGGDPTSVTLAGHSAGANSVLHHIFSPRPVGLFHRVIVMSPHDTWKLLNVKFYLNSTEVERKSRKIAKLLGCSSLSDHEVLKCMRARPVLEVINFKSDEMLDYFQPIPDIFLPESEQYLPFLPSTILSRTSYLNIKQLDLLVGSTDLNSMNFLSDSNYIKRMQHSQKAIYDYVTIKMIPEFLKALSLDRSEDYAMLTHAIEWEYWSSNFINEITGPLKALENVARMESAVKWSMGEAILFSKLAKQISRLYVYRYTQPSTVDLTGRHFNFSGAVHGADLIALLGDTLMLQVARKPASKNEKRISSIFRKYVVNFVKYGSPGNQNEWPPYVLENPNVHEICFSEESNCNKRSVGREVVFWLQYLPEFTKKALKSEQSEQFKSDKADSRLRGGVFAMCGVSVILLLLLFGSIILLHKRRTYRATISEDGTHL